MGWGCTCPFSWDNDKRWVEMLLMYKSHTTDTMSVLTILSFLDHECLAEALNVSFYDSRSRPHHCKISKIHVCHWGKFLCLEKTASARHPMQQVSSEIESDTRKMHIILRYTGCPSLALDLFFIFFLYQLQGRPFEHLFVHQHAKTVKRFVVQADKKRVYLPQHMKQQKHPSKPLPSQWH